jgi:hypothetical protein
MNSQRITMAHLRRNTVRVTRLIAVLCFCGLCGCSYVEPAGSLLPPYENPATYNQIKLKESTSADVLTAITKPKDELLSQSKSVVASQGIKKSGHKLWLNMVAFDENESTAKRKYFFVVDEKAESLLLWAKRKLIFDSEMVLDAKVLNEPYANENARRIAILKRVKEDIRQDVAEVATDNKKIGICGMLINQTLGTVLQKLDESPVLASKLSNPEGFGFDHITIGKGTIVMSITDDIVDVKVKAGDFVWSYEDPFALEE